MWSVLDDDVPDAARVVGCDERLQPLSPIEDAGVGS
jgi:hypothetical protein